MGTLYVRVGNRMMTYQEKTALSEKQINEIVSDGEKANRKRLENIQKSMGLEPQRVTLDVTPAGIAKRQAAIAAEEAKIAAETEQLSKDLGPETPASVSEGKTPAESTIPKAKKEKKK